MSKPVITPPASQRNIAQGVAFSQALAASAVGSARGRVVQVSLSDAGITFGDLAVAGLGGQLQLTADHLLQSASLHSASKNLQVELRETSNKLKKALTGGSSDAISSAIEGAVELGGYKLVVAELQGLEAADLRNVWDTVHQKVAGPVACVVASVTEKGTPALLAAASDDAVKAGFHAGNVIKQIAGLVDGRGGGRPNMAQAGGKNAAGIADALAAAKTALGA